MSINATPEQTAGPFFPHPALTQPFETTDLTNGLRAQGRVIQVEGTVRDRHGEPLEGAVVEIWQACASGKYNDEKDPNPAPLDPDFGYWGWMRTREDGRYAFRTIVPGTYPAESDWDRPPHIHFKVTQPGYADVVTQMYFAGERLNAFDDILLALSETERACLTADFSSGAGQFDITLSSGASHRSPRA